MLNPFHNELLTGIDRIRRERIPKLTLNIDDNDLFRWMITSGDPDSQPDATKASHSRLLEAYTEAQTHVANTVSNLDSKDHGDLLNTWVSFIEHKALVVLLRVPNDANAYKMFETLNDRGLRTSQADLIKNYLFGRAGDRIHEAQNRWSYMRGTLESLEEENITVDFLRHALITIHGYTRESDVYDTVQRMVRTEQEAISFASKLEMLATAYVATFNPEHEKWNGYSDSSRRGIEVLNLLNIRPIRALLLAITAQFSSEESEQAFQFAVSLGVRLLIARSTRSSSVELPLAAAASSIFHGNIDSSRDLRKRLRSITPTDQEFRSDFESARVSKTKLSRYYLRSLEMAEAGESEPWFLPTEDRSVINLEHVLPKRSEGNWPQFSDDEAAMYTNRLGNQVLMRASDNSDLRSGGFSTKKGRYGESPYHLTSQLVDLIDWSVTAITDRQKCLANLALKAWPI